MVNLLVDEFRALEGKYKFNIEGLMVITEDPRIFDMLVRSRHKAPWY